MKKIYALLILCLFFLTVSAQKYTLPKLNFAYEALAPYIDSTTMYIHLNMHHKAYVDNLNKALAGTPDSNMRLEQILVTASKQTEVVRNNAGGHYNHSLFWEILAPNAAKTPSPELSLEINNTFKSLDSLKTLINQTAASRFGSGWVWLIVTPDKKLKVTSSANQDNPLMDKMNSIRGLPILGIDLWEHAYYLNYQNRRGDYMKAIWNVIDWNAVSKKYNEALTSPIMKYLKGENWTAFRNFHDAMTDISMNAQKGDMQPIRDKTAEILKLARAMDTDPIPTAYATEEVKKAIKDIVADCTQLNDVVVKKGTDAALKEKLSTIREPFKVIMDMMRKTNPETK
jgi:hypothetical protein